jgi:hypothetical protein
MYSVPVRGPTTRDLPSRPAGRGIRVRSRPDAAATTAIERRFRSRTSAYTVIPTGTATGDGERDEPAGEKGGAHRRTSLTIRRRRQVGTVCSIAAADATTQWAQGSETVPSSAIVQRGLWATSQAWPSGSWKTPE